MRHALIVFASLFLSGLSASAIPAMDHLEIQLEGEAEGWLNATCTYYDLGWISKSNATVALERILLQAGHFLDREEVQRAQMLRSREILIANPYGQHYQTEVL